MPRLFSCLCIILPADILRPVPRVQVEYNSISKDEEPAKAQGSGGGEEEEVVLGEWDSVQRMRCVTFALLYRPSWLFLMISEAARETPWRPLTNADKLPRSRLH